MISKDALENLKEINRKQNNGNGDIWLESMIIEPIEKDLKILEILKKYLEVYDTDFVNEDGDDIFSIRLNVLSEYDFKIIEEWLDDK